LTFCGLASCERQKKTDTKKTEGWGTSRAFFVPPLSVMIRRMANEKQKRPSPFVASRLIRVIGFTFVVIWLLYVLYADPTRGTVNMAVSRTYLSLGGLFILLVFAFNAVANCVKMLEQRLKRLEETHDQSQSQSNAG
jgi:hypothetical protein